MTANLAGRAPPPARPTCGWEHQEKLPPDMHGSLTASLDRYASSRSWESQAHMLTNYVPDLPMERNLGQLVVAEMMYMYFRGPECPLIYSAKDDSWFVFRERWRTSKGSLTHAKATVQQHFLPAMQLVAGWAAQAGLSADKCKFAKKTVADLGCRLGVEALIKESAMFFDVETVFDENPYLFQLKNCLLDLRTNSFRPCRPSDMTRRCSSVVVPATWLEDPDLIPLESAQYCDAAWAVMWSMYSRAGEFHPDDHFDELGDQDEANFNHIMNLHARLLEGNPLGKCVILASTRGRNSKGLCEKIFNSVWGDYVAPVKSTVFNADRRSENDHTAAEVFRKGTRICFGNETLMEPWSNAIFKSKNSTDPVVARGCGSGETVRYQPTFTFVFAVNDPPAWEKPPNGSEQDRLMPIYFPNKFVDAGTAPTSPRTYVKDRGLEETVASSQFALGHLLNLIQLRIRFATNGGSLDNTVVAGTPTVHFWLSAWMKMWREAKNEPSSSNSIEFLRAFHQRYYDAGTLLVLEIHIRDDSEMRAPKASRWSSLLAGLKAAGTEGELMMTQTVAHSRKNKEQGAIRLFRFNVGLYHDIFDNADVFGRMAEYSYNTSVDDVVEESVASEWWQAVEGGKWSLVASAVEVVNLSALEACETDGLEETCERRTGSPAGIASGGST